MNDLLEQQGSTQMCDFAKLNCHMSKKNVLPEVENKL